MKRHAGVALAFALFLVAVSAHQADARKPRQAALPDLTISAISAPSSTSPGKTIAVSTSIRNQGRVTSVAFSISYYLSTTTSKTSSSLLLGVQNVGSLSAGTSVTIVTSLAIPSTTSIGTFYVVGLADSNAVVSESNETNNSSSSGAISVKDSTPPTISAVTSSGATASSATITWKTDEASSSQVEYGIASTYGSVTALATSLVTNHSVTLSGLTAGSVYHFRVHSKDSSGNAASSGDLTFTTATTAPTTTASTTGESVSYYQRIYDNEYQSNKASLDSMAADGWGESYYFFQYAFGGTLSMYEATKDIKYLERAITWAETMVSKATIIDSNGNRNWSGEWQSPYSPSPISYQLWDLQGSTELARLAKIILTDPTLRSTYGPRATTIYNFVRDHIVNKHLYARDGLDWFQSQSVQTTSVFNDKVALLIRILVNVYSTSASLGGADNHAYNYQSILFDFAQGFKDRKGIKARFEPYQGGLIWDKGLGDNGPIPPNDVTTGLDTSHANRYPYALVDLYKAGIVFTQEYVLGVSTLLTKVIWNQSMTDPRFTNFIDGTNYPAYDRPAWGLGNIYHGWVVLAEYDPQVRLVADAALKAILAGTSNPSLEYMNTVDGKISLSGHLAKAVAR